MRTLLEIGLLNAALAAGLAVGVAVVARLVRRPALAHALWLLVLLKLLTPPLVGVPLPLAPAGEPTVDEEAAAEAAAAMPIELRAEAALVAPAEAPRPRLGGPAASPARRLTVPWREGLAGVWLLGSVVWFLRTGWHVGRFQRLLRHARPAPVDLQDRARALAARLGLKRCPPLSLVPGVVSPMVWPVGQLPRLLFPTLLLDRLDAGQRDALVLHELAHVRRRDRWVRLVELVATGLYWWHPVVWWARREIHEAEEQCCDAWVVWGSAGAGRTYALALLEAVAFFSASRPALPAAASGIGPIPHLRRRLTMIVQAQTPRSLSWPAFLAVVGLGVVLLPLVPVRAQQPAAKPKTAPKPATPPAPTEELIVRQQAVEVLPVDRLKVVLDKPEVFQVILHDDRKGVLLLGGLKAEGEPKPARPTFLDLQPLANVKLTDNFHGAGVEGNSLAALPRGVHTFGGVKFQVGAGLLQLGSTALQDKPEKIEGIPVNCPVTKLYFLHATGYGGGRSKPGSEYFVADNTLIGRYRVHYEDTSVEVIPILYGKDVRDWWYLEDADEVQPGNVVWEGDNGGAKSWGARIRLYLTSWRNPKPDKKIVRIDFVSTNESAAAPFCVAITAEGR
jgi:beta-lactamase regulating signal transducer with metallopeptidase domain